MALEAKKLGEKLEHYLPFHNIPPESGEVAIKTTQKKEPWNLKEKNVHGSMERDILEKT